MVLAAQIRFFFGAIWTGLVKVGQWFATVVTDIIETIVEVIQGLLKGIGTGVVDYFKSLVLATSGTNTDGVMVYTDNLNEFGVFIFVLLGIGAAFGLAALVFRLIRNRA